MALLARDVDLGARWMNGEPGARDVGRRESGVASGMPGHRASAAVTVEQDPALAQARMEPARHEAKVRRDRIEGSFQRQLVMWETKLIAVVDDGNAAHGELKRRHKLGLFGVPSQSLDQTWPVVIAEHPGWL